MTAAPKTAVGLAGFGSSGRAIHAPLLQQAGMTVAAVATADPQRAEQVRGDLPGAVVVADLDALLAVAGLDLIVLATPSGLHADQARQCVDRIDRIGAGVAVVVDKPLATDATAAFGVVDAARAAGVALTVFQNRRFDAEHVAVRETLASGRLGEVYSHMVDAAVDLFGPIGAVYAEVAARTTFAEDDAFLACRHTAGVVSHLSATSVAAAPGPRVRILGTSGAFLLNQFEDDGADIYPDLAQSDPGQCGWIYTGEQRTPVTRPAAGQVDFYRQVRRALASEDPAAAMPVDPYDAVHTLAVIDAARASAATGSVIQVRTPGRR